MSTNSSAVPPFAAFPSRPLELARTPATVVPMVFRLLIGLVMLAGGLFMAGKLLPGLWKEASLRNQGAITYDVQLREGKCKTSKGMSTCTGKLLYRTLPEHGNRTLDGKLDIMVMFGLDDDAELYVKYQPDRPEVYTTSWGLNHFWNRVGTAGSLVALIVVVGLGFCVYAFAPLKRSRRLKASLVSPQASAVQLSNLRRHGKKMVVAVHHWRGGKERKFDQTFRKDEEPLFLGETDHALALMSPDGVPMVLDSSLSDLKLGHEERERILVAAQAWPQRA